MHGQSYTFPMLSFLSFVSVARLNSFLKKKDSSFLFRIKNYKPPACNSHRPDWKQEGQHSHSKHQVCREWCLPWKSKEYDCPEENMDWSNFLCWVRKRTGATRPVAVKESRSLGPPHYQMAVLWTKHLWSMQFQETVSNSSRSYKK